MNEAIFPEALKRCDGDFELLATTAAMVIEDAPIELQRLIMALQNEEVAQTGASAHALKGMLVTFEQSAAVSGLQMIENAAAQGDLNAARTLLNDVRTDIDLLINKIRAIC